MLYLRSHHPQLVYISFCPFFKSVSSQSESGLFFICPSLLFSSLHPSVCVLFSGYAAAGWGCVSTRCLLLSIVGSPKPFGSPVAP